MTLLRAEAGEPCPCCGWIDDPAQGADKKNLMGMNPVSLEYAQMMWAKGQPMGLLGGFGFEQRQHDIEAMNRHFSKRPDLWETFGNLILPPGVRPPLHLEACPCCGERTLLVRGQHDTCDVCGWIDDVFQNTHPDSHEGPNDDSLNETRDLYQIDHTVEVEDSFLAVAAAG
jgi:hypothetical protein